MRSLRKIIVLTMVICSASSPLPRVAQAADPIPLLDMLALLPVTIDVISHEVSYVDVNALIAARQGAAHPRSVGEFASLDPNSEPARLHRAALIGIRAGNADVMQTLLRAQDSLQSTGVDLFAIDRHLVAGQPPAMLNILTGAFDPNAIIAAFTAKNYVMTERGGLRLLCPADGCGQGQKLDFNMLDRANPFGGKLGRQELLAVSATTLLNSPAQQQIDRMIERYNQPGNSLADNAMYATAARALGRTGNILQGFLLPATIASTLDPQLPPQVRQTIIDSYTPIPQYWLAGFAHIQRESDQAVVVVLIYDSEAQAEQAAAEVGKRIASYRSNALRKTLVQGVTEIGGKIEAAATTTDAATGKAAAVFTFSFPYETNERFDGQLRASGLLFGRFVQFWQRRDMLWLVVDPAQ